MSKLRTNKENTIFVTVYFTVLFLIASLLYIVDHILGIFIGVLLILTIISVCSILKGRNDSQTCFVYCPGCKQDLVSRVGVDGTKLHDKTDQGEKYLEYKCGICKTSSWWDFDSYPLPVAVSASTARAWVTDEDGTLVETEPWYSEGWWTVK